MNTSVEKPLKFHRFCIGLIQLFGFFGVEFDKNPRIFYDLLELHENLCLFLLVSFSLKDVKDKEKYRRNPWGEKIFLCSSQALISSLMRGIEGESRVEMGNCINGKRSNFCRPERQERMRL